MANYSQRMEYTVSSPVQKDSAISGLADSGFDTFDLSSSPTTKSPDLNGFADAPLNGRQYSPEIFDPLQLVPENGNDLPLLDVDFFDPLAPLPEEFPSPRESSIPGNTLQYTNSSPEDLLVDVPESSSNGLYSQDPADFFSSTVEADEPGFSPEEEEGSLSEGVLSIGGSLMARERDSGAECDSLDDEVQQRASPVAFSAVGHYQMKLEKEIEFDGKLKHEEEDDELIEHDAVDEEHEVLHEDLHEVPYCSPSPNSGGYYDDETDAVGSESAMEYDTRNDSKENINACGVSINHLKNSYLNDCDARNDERPTNIEKEIVTGVDIRMLKENYCHITVNGDSDLNKEKIETGVSIQELKNNYGETSRFRDDPSSQRARSMGDLSPPEESRRLNEFTFGVSVQALKTTFTSNENPESPGVKIDRAKITRSFSQEQYPLYALLDINDSVMSRDEQNNLCRICGRPVFLMDRIKAEKSVFHRTCFRCKECSKRLTVDSYCSHEGVLYCKLHFKQMFQPKPKFDDEGPHIPRRKSESVIKENTPMELPPDVIRSSDKPDHGLEELPSLRNIKSRFEQGEDEEDFERGVSLISVKRSESILNKMAKFQNGNENGHYEDSSSDEETVDRDPDVIRETKKKEKLYTNAKDVHEEVVFTGMNDLRTQWEKGNNKEREEEWTKETQEELHKLRQKICQGKGNVKSVYENAIQQEAERNSNKDYALDIGEIRSMADKWERGDVTNENDNDKWQKEKEEDLSILGTSEARTIFKKIEETAIKTGTPTIHFNKSSSVERARSMREPNREVPPSEIVKSTVQKEEIKVDSTNLHERFKFFENYQEQSTPKRFAMTPPRDLRPEAEEPIAEIPPPSDPNIVRACDREEEVIVTDTAKKMLNKFRELETMAERGEILPQGPKPLKRITPPREYTVESDEHDSSPEPDRDPNVIRASDKIEDVLLIEADKARNLKQKFENWSNEDDDYMRSYEEDGGQPSIDTAKNLKAKFEALREETQRANEKPKFKVNRFV